MRAHKSKYSDFKFSKNRAICAYVCTYMLQSFAASSVRRREHEGWSQIDKSQRVEPSKTPRLDEDNLSVAPQKATRNSYQLKGTWIDKNYSCSLDLVFDF